MQDNSKKGQKILFIRIDESIYKAVAELADSEDRSINSMATRLLKESLKKTKTSLSS